MNKFDYDLKFEKDECGSAACTYYGLVTDFISPANILIRWPERGFGRHEDNAAEKASELASEVVKRWNAYNERPTPAPQVDAWRGIDSAPRDGTEIRAKVSEMSFLIKWQNHGFLDDDCKECGGWIATKEGEHPSCWSGGVCWASNEEESPSIIPTHWMPLPALPQPPQEE